MIPKYRFSKTNLFRKNSFMYRVDYFYNSFNYELLTFKKFNKILPSSKQSSLKNSTLQNYQHFVKNYSFFLQQLVQHIFKFTNYLVNTNITYNTDDLLTLNYKRRNFFPNVSSKDGKVLVTSSLGLFARMLNKGKSFIRNKSVYLMSAMFIRKLLIYSSIRQITVFVKRQPLYLNEILSTLFKPVINLYKHPFNNKIIDEKSAGISFKFLNIIFMQNKNYTNYKTRKRGRLKRRIMKRLIKVNNVLD